MKCAYKKYKNDSGVAMKYLLIHQGNLEANLRIGSTTQMIKPFPSLAYTQQ
jgi:hypothetical protein